MKQRMIGVNTNCYHGYSLHDALEGIAMAGFHYVELTATEGWTEHVFRNQSFETLCAAQDKMRSLGLLPFAMSGHCNLMDEMRLAAFERNMRLARFFGCEYIVSSIGEAHMKDLTTSGNDLLVKHIKSLLPDLERNALRLVLELHGEHSTGAVLREITEKVGSPLVGINYDTANAIFYGGVDPATDIACCIDQVYYLHIKDKAGEQRDWNFPALGKGSVDFPEIFRQLDSADNAAPLSIEIEFTQAGPCDLAEVNRAVSDSADYLRGLGCRL